MTTVAEAEARALNALRLDTDGTDGTDGTDDTEGTDGTDGTDGRSSTSTAPDRATQGA